MLLCPESHQSEGRRKVLITHLSYTRTGIIKFAALVLGVDLLLFAYEQVKFLTGAQ